MFLNQFLTHFLLFLIFLKPLSPLSKTSQGIDLGVVILVISMQNTAQTRDFRAKNTVNYRYNWKDLFLLKNTILVSKISLFWPQNRLFENMCFSCFFVLPQMSHINLMFLKKGEKNMKFDIFDVKKMMFKPLFFHFF